MDIKTDEATSKHLKSINEDILSYSCFHVESNSESEVSQACDSECRNQNIVMTE